MLSFLYICLFYIWLAALVVAAFRWGLQPERWAIFAYAIGAALTLLVRSAPAVKYHNVELGVMAVDLAYLAVIVAVALRSYRWWPICAAALHLTSVIGHLAKLLVPDLSRLTYALMIGLPGYPILAVLTVGLIMRHRVTRPSRTAGS
jgi:hypothetical protein